MAQDLKQAYWNEKGNLCIAKFPSRKDDYDAGLWEHFSHLLAQKAGILVAQTRVLGGLGKYHTLLSKRFDRTAEAKRIHFASSMSLLGLRMVKMHKVVMVISILLISYSKVAAT